MASTPNPKPLSQLFSDGTLLGGDTLVAPINSTPSPTIPGGYDTPQVGDVLQLPRRDDASYKMAPPLCEVIRESLQRKQVSAENISFYLKKLKNLGRYDTSFRQLWAWCITQDKDPLSLDFRWMKLRDSL